MRARKFHTIGKKKADMKRLYTKGSRFGVFPLSMPISYLSFSLPFLITSSFSPTGSNMILQNSVAYLTFAFFYNGLLVMIISLSRDY